MRACRPCRCCCCFQHKNFPLIACRVGLPLVCRVGLPSGKAGPCPFHGHPHTACFSVCLRLGSDAPRASRAFPNRLLGAGAGRAGSLQQRGARCDGMGLLMYRVPYFAARCWPRRVREVDLFADEFDTSSGSSSAGRVRRRKPSLKHIITIFFYLERNCTVLRGLRELFRGIKLISHTMNSLFKLERWLRHSWSSA